MSILPLPQFEADLEAAQRADRELHAAMAAPETVVVRFGRMKLIGEYRYDGDVKPGCGSKLLVKTHRGLEIGELLTSTCPNAGCSKSVTRKQMLEYIENSGGSDFPFYTDGRALRVATVEELARHNTLQEQEPELRRRAQALADSLRLPMKVIHAEQILGGERLTLYFISEERVDFRELLEVLRSEFRTRIDLRHVGARDEARLIADYERCGQHCCCKQFLKVLKPVSMRSAKQQKATLDPLKISGRCGRLMCCLRYEDETYRELDKRLPKMGKRVGTPHGIGQVVDRQILTQLVLVRLEDSGQRVAVPVEEIVKPEDVATVLGKASDPMRGMDEQQVAGRTARQCRSGSRQQAQDNYRERSQREDTAERNADAAPEPGEPAPRRKKKRRVRGRPEDDAGGALAAPSAGDGSAEAGAGAIADRAVGPASDAASEPATGVPRKKKKKRRRKVRPDSGPDALGDGASAESRAGGRPEDRGEGRARTGRGESAGEGGDPARARRVRRRRRPADGEAGSAGGAEGAGRPSGPRPSSGPAAEGDPAGPSRRKRRRPRRPGNGPDGAGGPGGASPPGGGI
jgi:cell fate regulator YaaT (PSP1 superfamily)